MASKQNTSQFAKLGDVFHKYDSHLQTFKTFNSMMLLKMRELNTELKVWGRGWPSSTRESENQVQVLKELRQITSSHEVAKSMTDTMEVLYTTVSGMLNRNGRCSTPGQAVSMSTSRGPLSEQVECDGHTLGDVIIQDFQFNTLKYNFSDSLLIPMLMESAEERSILNKQSGKYKDKKAHQRRSISMLYEDLCGPPPETSQCDVTGYHPSDQIFMVLRESMKKYRNDCNIFFIIAEICSDYYLLIEELDFPQYQTITTILFEDASISNLKLLTLWYFTKCFISKQIKNAEKSKVWSHMQKLLQKYC